MKASVLSGAFYAETELRFFMTKYSTAKIHEIPAM